MRKGAPLSVDVPSADRDTPGWVKVSAIAVVGFVIGVAWPRVIGVRLGPSAPNTTASKASPPSSTKGAPADSTNVEAKQVTAKAAASAPASASAAVLANTNAAARPVEAAPAPISGLSVRVQRGAVLSCRTEGGETKRGTRECGPLPALDAVIAPRLRKLTTCSAAQEQSGKLSLVFGADFSNDKLTWDIGKSTNVGNVEAIRGCLETILGDASVKGVAHEHARYTVAYASNLGAEAEANASRDGGATKARTETNQASSDLGQGERKVGWESATVRDAPRSGQIIAQLARGTKVKVSASKDGWYAVRFGDGFGREGWVHRGALSSAR